MAKTDSEVREAPDLFFFPVRFHYYSEEQVCSMHAGAFVLKCVVTCCFIDYLLSFVCNCYCCVWFNCELYSCALDAL